MVIGTSTVAMSSQSTKKVSYTENKQVLMRNLATGEKQYSQNTFNNTYEEVTKENKKLQNGPQIKDNLLKDKDNKGKHNKKSFTEDNLDKTDKNDNVNSNLPIKLNERENTSSLIEQLRVYLFTLRKRVQLMIGKNNYFGYFNDTVDLTTDFSGASGFSLWRRTEYSSYTYEEKSEMSFSTKGTAVTADGREIEFNMELSMSHEFLKESEEFSSGVVAIMTDPLVINLTDSPITVSDQKWMFDIDADNQIDSISMLSEGAGYLVLDKNHDGIINDGSEMFGAKTGNGFGELSAYDEDGNGWIDENDSIYKQLAVWIKDSAGHDIMKSLKETNVGAIYLGNVSSEFALKSKRDNNQNAQIRRSGMYLTEEGKSRSLQQLDMVKALIS